MSANTSIEWTDRTWNPLTGCTKVSPGCDHCYAKTMHERFNGAGSFDTVELHPERLDHPLRWRKPARVFVNSMSDLFHRDVPDDYIARVFAVMAAAPKHTFQVLTKRHGRMRSLLNDAGFADAMRRERMYLPHTFVASSAGIPWPLPNVWLGVSVEDQKWADIRIPALLDTPAAVRFLSCEPLLGAINLAQSFGKWRPGDGEAWADGRLFASEVLHWVIVGGESGPSARPMHPDWPRTLRDQCEAAGVPFLFKQHGEWAPAGIAIHAGVSGATTWKREDIRPAEHWFPGSPDERFTHTVVQRVGKKAAGRVLDGRTWDEYPS